MYAHKSLANAHLPTIRTSRVNIFCLCFGHTKQCSRITANCALGTLYNIGDLIGVGSMEDMGLTSIMPSPRINLHSASQLVYVYHYRKEVLQVFEPL